VTFLELAQAYLRKKTHVTFLHLAQA